MRYVLLIVGIMFFSGCMAVVDEKNHVTSYGLSKEETLDLLERADKVPVEKKKEYIFWEKEKNQE